MQQEGCRAGRRVENQQRLDPYVGAAPEAVAKFGAPDDDLDPGTTVLDKASDAEPPRVTSYRTLRYKRLSQTADVDLTDFGPERGLRVCLMAKYTGEAKS